MVIVNPRIHMICGICGDNNSLSFSFSENNFLLEGFEDEIEAQSIMVICNNCHSITSLDEIINEEPTDWVKITENSHLPDARVLIYRVYLVIKMQHIIRI